MKRILVTGSQGQVGADLVPVLRQKYGNENVVGTIHKKMPSDKDGPYEKVDVMDKDQIVEVIKKYDIDTVFHLASVLSARGEKEPDLAWDLNVNSLKLILDIAKDHNLKIFWASSIAAFGPNTPRDNTPQMTVMDPNTMYGVTKVTGELLCNYYFQKFRVDVRGLRYPGLISWKAPPGQGTTDYAVEIFYGALKEKKYKCYLKEDTILPMMYMDDGIKATIEIMEADPSRIRNRMSYNLAAISFTPKEIAQEVKKHVPELEVTYEPDFRQKIADSWPKVINDSAARKDWGWNHKFGLAEMTKVMLENLSRKLGVKS